MKNHYPILILLVFSCYGCARTDETAYAYVQIMVTGNMIDWHLMEPKEAKLLRDEVDKELNELIDIRGMIDNVWQKLDNNIKTEYPSLKSRIQYDVKLEKADDVTPIFVLSFPHTDPNVALTVTNLMKDEMIQESSRSKYHRIYALTIPPFDGTAQLAEK